MLATLASTAMPFGLVTRVPDILTPAETRIVGNAPGARRIIDADAL
jgi:hypothetical protein